MKVSVTIATWKRPDLLQLVLGALANQTVSHSHFEIVVCDSNSGAETDQVVSSFRSKYPTINLKHVQTANILAAKRNIGVRSATNEIVVFLDDDCVPESRFIEKYIKYFKEINNRKVVLCGEVRYPIKWVVRSNYFRFRQSRHFGSGRRPELESGTLDCRTIVVMNMGFLKSEYQSSGMSVNEKFVGYGCEDHEFGYRLISAGFRILPTDICIEHWETSGSLDGYKKKFFHTSRDGMATLIRENSSVVEAIGASVLEDAKSIWYGNILHMLLMSPLVRLIDIFLRITDRVPLFYFPPGYKIVLARSYLEGKAQRVRSLDINNITDGWYE